MPLIIASQYREFIDVAGKSVIGPTAGDAHDSLLHFVLAVDPKSQTMQMGGNFLAGLVHSDPLAWIGSWASFCVDNDPLWAEMSKIKDDRELGEFFDANFNRLPVALLVDVSSGLRLTAFLAGLRAMVDQNGARHDRLGVAHLSRPAVCQGRSVPASQKRRSPIDLQSNDLLFCLRRVADRHAERGDAPAGA